MASSAPRYWRDTGTILRATSPGSDAPLEVLSEDGTAWVPTGASAGALVWDLDVIRMSEAEVEVLELPD